MAVGNQSRRSLRVAGELFPTLTRTRCIENTSHDVERASLLCDRGSRMSFPCFTWSTMNSVAYIPWSWSHTQVSAACLPHSSRSGARAAASARPAQGWTGETSISVAAQAAGGIYRKIAGGEHRGQMLHPRCLQQFGYVVDPSLI